LCGVHGRMFLNRKIKHSFYKKEVINVKAADKLEMKLMNGGGWAARFEKTE
jgi:hypothetical protein